MHPLYNPDLVSLDYSFIRSELCRTLNNTVDLSDLNFCQNLDPSSFTFFLFFFFFLLLFFR